jgi:hypothetical protein
MLEPLFGRDVERLILEYAQELIVGGRYYDLAVFDGQHWQALRHERAMLRVRRWSAHFCVIDTVNPNSSLARWSLGLANSIRFDVLGFWPSANSVLCGLSPDAVVISGSGLGASSDLFVYDCSFERGLQWSSLPPLFIARQRHVVVKVADCIYVLGGIETPQTEIYKLQLGDATTRTRALWHRLGLEMPVRVASFACAVRGSTVFVVGGFRDYAMWHPFVQQLETETGVWSHFPLPPGLSNAVVFRGELHVCGPSASFRRGSDHTWQPTTLARDLAMATV